MLKPHSFAVSMMNGSNWFVSWQDRSLIRISRVLALTDHQCAGDRLFGSMSMLKIELLSVQGKDSIRNGSVASCRPHDSEAASKSISWAASRAVLFATSLAVTSASAQSLEFSPSLRLTGFADTPTQGDISSDTLFSGRVDA